MKLKDWYKENEGIFVERDLRFLIHRLLPHVQPVWGDVTLGEDECCRLQEVKEEYTKGVPLAYLLGVEEFFGIEFVVNRDVLIPRQETELIVERALFYSERAEMFRVLDVGCGCGTIAFAMRKKSAKPLFLTASDISWQALNVAADNRARLGVEVALIESDMFAAFKTKSFDMIVSNPPYVAAGLITGSLCYEPRLALDGGIEGMQYISHLIANARYYLKEGGYLLLEIGYDQREKTARCAEENGYTVQEWIRDYAGHWRGVVLREGEKHG
jgi:release factor glutamine methyltransferase